MSAAADEAADAGALVALLDLVPPALGLVLQHGGLFDENLRLAEEIEECAVGTGHGGEELPAGEDGDAAGSDGARDQVGRGIVRRRLSMRERLRRACTAASSFSETGVSVSGSSSASSSGVEERCDSGSNLRMDSISSPKKSMRTGRSISGE